jgi:hypothetical protein
LGYLREIERSDSWVGGSIFYPFFRRDALTGERFENKGFRKRAKLAVINYGTISLLFLLSKIPFPLKS